MTELWIGPEDELASAVESHPTPVYPARIIGEGSFDSESISRWVGCPQLPPGEHIFTLRAPIGGDGTSSWTQYRGGSWWAPERDMKVLEVLLP